MKPIKTIIYFLVLVLSGLPLKSFASTAVDAPGSADTVVTVSHDSPQNDFSYIPELHGVMRTRWEMATESGESRFQVRNARLSLKGRVAPIISYYLQTDFCDAGKIKILDAWSRIDVSRHVFVQAGQYRMPFGTDSFRGPASYFFNNRSFIGRYVCNIRGVGLKGRYSFSHIPLWLEGAVFNPSSISDHSKWNKRYAYAAKASWEPGDFRVETGFMSLRPENVRINLTGASLAWSAAGWTLEGEYMYKHYTNDAARPVHAFNLFADYGIGLRNCLFDRLSFQGRFDSMTAHSDGKNNDQGLLEAQLPSRSRITAGATLSYRYKIVKADVRLDYEKYFYGGRTRPDSEAGDRVSLELIISF